jgi:small nuclear ribonucleoprotein G
VKFKNSYVFSEEQKLDKRKDQNEKLGTAIMSKAHPPELKKFMDKRIHLKINGGRAVEGVLRGFDPFMNLVIDESVEYKKDGSKNQIGMVVVRGNSVVMLEAKDRV